MNSLSEFLDKAPWFLRRHKTVRFLLASGLAAPVQLVEFNQGAHLYADIRDPFPRAYFLTKSYDQEFSQIASFFLEDNGNFFDVGANVGFCAFGLLNLFLGKNVNWHLFEANPAMCELLKKSAALFPGEKIHVRQAAITDHEGASKLMVVRNHLGGSYLSLEGALAVPNLRLDDYVKSNAISKIDFLKIDIEGSELSALRGIEGSITQGKCPVIFFETSPITLARFGLRPEDCFEFLKEKEYSLFFIRQKDLTEVGTGDALIPLRRGNRSMNVLRMTHYPKNRQTDVLALHKDAGFLSKEFS